MDTAITAVLTIVGWLAVYILTLRAQDKSLRNQIVDRARIEITDRIRDAQGWLSRLGATVSSLEIAANLEEKGYPTNWLERCAEVGGYISSHDEVHAWNRRMEEYLILFPECSEVRVELGARTRSILQALSEFHSKLLSTAGDRGSGAARRELFAGMDSIRESCWDLATLLEDLRIHLQNVSLQAITGNRVPARKPPDPKVPRMEQGHDGHLAITYGTDCDAAV